MNLFFPMKTRILSVLFFFFFSFSVDSQSRKPDVQELMQMDLDSAFGYIHKLSKTETDALITQFRVEARKDYKDIDKFYLLISHLENIKAIEEEHKKLKDLNMVYLLGLFLILGLTGYLLYSQRKILESIRQINSE